MNRKRIEKLVIVLFLLSALPVMTAVMAQGQEPAAQAPAAMEVGESAVAIPWTNTESEPNNTVNAADAWCRNEYSYCGGVNGGIIDGASDVDYWKVFVPGTEYEDEVSKKFVDRDNYPVLIDIEAVSMGSPLDASICLYSDDGYEVGCSNNTYTNDPMLYFNFEVGRNYYLAVWAHNGAGAGPNGKYQLLVSTPYLFSAAATNLGTGYVDGIAFQSGDILAYSEFKDDYYKWVLLFDLSDLVKKGSLVNLSSGWRNSDYLLVSFAANITLPGIGRAVTPWEVVVFDPTQIGPATTGSFQLWWDGRQQGLTLAAEKLDAVDWPNWAGDTRLIASTIGTAKVYGGPATTLKLLDEDLGLWMMSGSDEFYPRWSRAIHMSGWDSRIVDVLAYTGGRYEDRSWNESGEWGDETYQYGYFVAQGTAFSQKNVMTFGEHCYSPSPGEWECNYGVGDFWNGPAHGWNYNIDAIQVQRTVFGEQ